MVKFEWDDDKNELNIEKHGLDFEDAPEIFESPMLAALDLRQDYGEDRWIGLGLIENRVVVAVYTFRETETIRIISLRKALHHEKQHYQEFLINQLGSG